METVSLDLMGMSPTASPEEMSWRSPGTTCLEWDPDSPTCWSYDPKEVANSLGLSLFTSQVGVMGGRSTSTIGLLRVVDP